MAICYVIFLQKVRRLATERSIVLIFDECTTGFREICGGIHMKYKIYPDMCVLGKTLGNGYAITAVLGKKEIMEAANRGASEAGAKTVGLNINLPHEQFPNPYVSPELCFQFHYFALRKMHFLMRAKALIAFPGGFGTMDELFEVITLIQTDKIKRFPIVLFGTEYWGKLVDQLERMAEAETIHKKDLELLLITDSVEEGMQHITTILQEKFKLNKTYKPNWLWMEKRS